MRTRRWCTRLAVLGCLGLLQCAAPQPVPVRSPFLGVPAALRVVEPQFRDGLGRLTTARPWPTFGGEELQFDWLLLGVRVQWEGGTERIWFVRVAEIIDPEEAEGGRRLRDRRFAYSVPFAVGSIRAGTKFTVPCRRLRIETYDARGEFIAAWSRLTPSVFPESSLYQALATLPRGRLAVDSAAAPFAMDGDTIAQRISDRSVYELIATLQTLGTTPPLLPIREAVSDHIVGMPSVVGMVIAAIKPKVTASPQSAEEGEFPSVFASAPMPCLQSAFAVKLAGEAFLHCRVATAPNLPPMDLLHGVLMLEAVHPDKPGNRLSVRVLASSRSSGGR